MGRKKQVRHGIPLKASALFLVITIVVTATIFKLVELTINNDHQALPKIEISLSSVTIEEVDWRSKDLTYLDNIMTLSTKNSRLDFKDVEIKSRGNSTWGQPKKPYQIKLQTKIGLLGQSKSKKWILLANYLDRSHLRTDTAFYLENILGENPLTGNFVELYIDDTYRGLYYLTNKLEIGKQKINLKDEFGVIVELDNLHGSDSDEYAYTEDGNRISVYEAVNKDNAKASLDIFISSFNELVSAITEKNYDKVVSLADIDSFARYYLLSEFTNNPDAYSSSFFFFKDGIDDKIHVGPGWDFDYAFGNPLWTAEGVDENLVLSPSSSTVLKNYLTESGQNTSSTYISSIASVVHNLLDFPEFEQKVRELYQATLSKRSEELLAHIKDQASYIKNAALHDQSRWKLKTNFDEEVEYLIDWIEKRYDHLEEIYGVKSQNLTF